MLGSAPQLQATGVAYLCGDCGELERREDEKREKPLAIPFFFSFVAAAVGRWSMHQRLASLHAPLLLRFFRRADLM